jgi:predicted nucleic acid-binding protein
MRHLFVDTFYLLALAHPRDQWRVRVLTFSQSLRDYHLYTVDEVLAEFLTACSSLGPHIRQRAGHTVRNALQESQWTVLPQSRASLLEALTLYEARPDKAYSLTDCISMQAMRREGLTDVLTNDHHFTQEGFHILFP